MPAMPSFRISATRNTRVHVLAMWNGKSVDENFYYQLAGSPCEGVLSGEIVAYNSKVVEKFPREKEDLEKMGAESYLAIPLRNIRGEVLGHLAVIDTKPKDWAERDFEILRIFAARATAEIERQIADREMQAANAALARRVELEALIAAISTRIVTAEHGTVGAEIERTLGTSASSSAAIEACYIDSTRPTAWPHWRSTGSAPRPRADPACPRSAMTRAEGGGTFSAQGHGERGAARATAAGLRSTQRDSRGRTRRLAHRRTHRSRQRVFGDSLLPLGSRRASLADGRSAPAWHARRNHR